MKTESKRDVEIGKMIFAYSMDPQFIERHYRMPAITDLLKRPGAIGVSRLVEVPAFDPERIHTFVYGERTVEIISVVGSTSLWYSLGRYTSTDSCLSFIEFPPEVFNPAALRVGSTLSLSAARRPAMIRTWRDLKNAALMAPSCDTEMLDGIGYRHSLCDAETSSRAEWHTPDEVDHQPQCGLINAYLGLLASADLFPEYIKRKIRRKYGPGYIKSAMKLLKRIAGRSRST